MRLELIELIRFHAKGKTKLCTRTIAMLHCARKIDSQETYEWTNKETNFIIPRVASTSNGTSKIIDISYLLKLNFSASGVSKSKDMPLPIVIGTMPFRDTNQPVKNENESALQLRSLASTFENTINYSQQ